MPPFHDQFIIVIQYFKTLFLRTERIFSVMRQHRKSIFDVWIFPFLINCGAAFSLFTKQQQRLTKDEERRNSAKYDEYPLMGEHSSTTRKICHRKHGSCLINRKLLTWLWKFRCDDKRAQFKRSLLNFSSCDYIDKRAYVKDGALLMDSRRKECGRCRLHDTHKHMSSDNSSKASQAITLTAQMQQWSRNSLSW